MRIPQAHGGERLTVSRKVIPFGLWPTRIGETGNHSLQPLLFSLDPWAIIERAIEERCPIGSKPEAFACFAQARDFFDSGTNAQRMAARPLTMYYGFMNLVKAFCLTRGTRATFDKAQHGMSEQLAPVANPKEFVDAFLKAFPSPSARGELQNFSEFMFALSGQGLAAVIDLKLPELIPQIVPGHRLWAQANRKPERFIAIHEIQFWIDRATKKMWLRLNFVAEDFTRLALTTRDFLAQTGLATILRQVQCSDQYEGKKIICLEQTIQSSYAGTKPANELDHIISPIKSYLWATVSAIPPYRRYYCYVHPTQERPSILPQLLSIYAVTYYLGSITRYRPHHFDNLLRSQVGPRIQDFVTGQPQQFLYLLASEFSKQDIAKPSIL